MSLRLVSVVAAISIVGQVALTRDPIPTPVGEHFANFTTPYEALSLTTSLLTTLLIIFRVYLVQRTSRKLGIDTKGQFGQYSRIIEILVESAALYSVNLIAFLVLTVRKDIRLSYPELIHPQIAVSGFLLLQCQILSMTFNRESLLRSSYSASQSDTLDRITRGPQLKKLRHQI